MQTFILLVFALTETSTTPDVVVHAPQELRVGVQGAEDPTQPQRVGRSHLEAELARRLEEVRTVHEPEDSPFAAASALAWQPEATWGRDPTEPSPDAPTPGRSWADRALSSGVAALWQEHQEAKATPPAAPQEPQAQ